MTNATKPPTWWERVQARDATSHDADAPVQVPGDTYHRRGVDRRELIHVAEQLRVALRELTNEARVIRKNRSGRVLVPHPRTVQDAENALALLDRPAEEVDRGE